MKFGVIPALAASLLSVSLCTNAAQISQTRSSTIYEPIGADWEISNAALLRDRIRLAKNTGMNAVWLIVEWDKLDPNPSTTGDVALIDCVLGANYTKYQCRVERALAVVREEGVDVFLSINYAGGDAPPSFTDAVDGATILYGDNPQKLYRQARYIARLVTAAGIATQARILFHDEGILAPLDDLWQHPEIQQRFRDYLYAKNPDLSYWNTRWGRVGTDRYTSWPEVKTFNNRTHGLLDPQLQDHVGWVNWTLQQTLGSGAFEASVRQIAPAALVGIHSTYFRMITADQNLQHRAQPPLGNYSSFDFVSVPFYEGSSPFGYTLENYVSSAKTFFGDRPLLVGELGSQICEFPGSPISENCGQHNGQWWTGYRVQRQQANFLANAVSVLDGQAVGFNIWNLNEFSFANGEGSFGVYASTYGEANTADKPRFKRASCALRTALGSSHPALCLAEAGINNAYSPRAVWLTGRGFTPSTLVRPSNAAGTIYGSVVQPVYGSSMNLSLQLSDQVFSDLGCGPNTVKCTIGLEVLDGSPVSASNRIIVEVN